MTGERFDLVVIGGGPAGAAAARAGGQAGLRTVVLEAASFPRPRTCAGLISAAALGDIELRFGATPPAALADPALLPGLRVHLGRGAAHPLELPWPAVRVRRPTFDEHLLARCGADVRLRVRVTGVEPGLDEVLVRCEGGAELRARVAVVATGAAPFACPGAPDRRHLAFAGRVRYESRTVDRRELLLLGEPRDGLVAIDPDAGGVTISIALKDPRRFKLARNRAVAFAQAALSLGLKRELGGQFGWSLRAPPRVGQGRVLLAGEAGGWTHALGLGIEAAVATGLAAGAAAASPDDPLADYAARVRAVGERLAGERATLPRLLGRLDGFARGAQLGQALGGAGLTRRIQFGLRLHGVLRQLDEPALPPGGFPLP